MSEPLSGRRARHDEARRRIRAVPSPVWSAALLLGALARIVVLRARLRTAWREAHQDDLTGLANRRQGLRILSSHRTRMVAVLDLDGFKAVNDTFGHAAGDGLLQEIASRLEQAMGRHGVPVRLGGDEFLLIWYRRPPSPGHETRRILGAVTAPFPLDGQLIHPCASMGAAVRSPGLSGLGLLAAADRAMYTAKTRTGTAKDGISIYTGAVPPAPIDRRTGHRDGRAHS